VPKSPKLTFEDLRHHSQLPVAQWHEYLAEPTLAEAILDRIVHHSHRIALNGESLRKNKPTEKAPRKP
jgi:DNA replication protein DnaC